mmetsp:Transcript_21466/g.40889  ORF Transcript_21466/g.40889 Transcript_21466/m.40889 type:complete len:721 (-) Transcript_21466:132-2294(-)
MDVCPVHPHAHLAVPPSSSNKLVGPFFQVCHTAHLLISKAGKVFETLAVVEVPHLEGAVARGGDQAALGVVKHHARELGAFVCVRKVEHRLPSVHAPHHDGAVNVARHYLAEGGVVHSLAHRAHAHVVSSDAMPLLELGARGDDGALLGVQSHGRHAILRPVHALVHYGLQALVAADVPDLHHLVRAHADELVLNLRHNHLRHRRRVPVQRAHGAAGERVPEHDVALHPAGGDEVVGAAEVERVDAARVLVHHPLHLLALEVQHAQRGVHGGGHQAARVVEVPHLRDPVRVQLEGRVAAHPGQLLVPHLHPGAWVEHLAAPEVVKGEGVDAAAVVPPQQHVKVRLPHPVRAHRHVVQVVHARQRLHPVRVPRRLARVVKADGTVHRGHRHGLSGHVRHVCDPARPIPDGPQRLERAWVPQPQQPVAPGGDVSVHRGHQQNLFNHVLVVGVLQRVVGLLLVVGLHLQEARRLVRGLRGFEVVTTRARQPGGGGPRVHVPLRPRALLRGQLALLLQHHVVGELVPVHGAVRVGVDLHEQVHQLLLRLVAHGGHAEERGHELVHLQPPAAVVVRRVKRLLQLHQSGQVHCLSLARSHRLVQHRRGRLLVLVPLRHARQQLLFAVRQCRFVWGGVVIVVRVYRFKQRRQRVLILIRLVAVCEQRRPPVAAPYTLMSFAVLSKRGHACACPRCYPKLKLADLQPMLALRYARCSPSSVSSISSSV